MMNDIEYIPTTELNNVFSCSKEYEMLKNLCEERIVSCIKILSFAVYTFFCELTTYCYIKYANNNIMQYRVNTVSSSISSVALFKC